MNINLPLAVDRAEGKPSVTLLFSYLSFLETFVLIIIVAYQGQLLYALIASFVLFLISIFFYRARKIDTLKVGKEGFEISDDDDNEESDTERGPRAPVDTEPPPEAS